ncbi:MULTISPECIES: hypothetical protein [unclassified Haematospirillum]|uniref:hypothetical protein n=1 Tax=unclassified Haematospirillum TaxID=2622088 RepID=UPI00143B42E9|nr:MULTISPECIES: hypothetical protein [unclassified Haematospirillum]NKD54823.1 hypothetical protein [Haematospirillum sp. H4890]NKD74661.1 hypothetical protein [Haematospirillum sp. H4485]
MSSFMPQAVHSPNAQDSIDYADESGSVVASTEQPDVSTQGQPTSGQADGAGSDDTLSVGPRSDVLGNVGKGNETLNLGPVSEFLVGGNADTTKDAPEDKTFVRQNASHTQGDVITDFNQDQGDTINFSFMEEGQYDHNHQKPESDPEPMLLPLNGTSAAPYSTWYQVVENDKDFHLSEDADGQVDTHEIAVTAQDTTGLQNADLWFG